MKLVVMGVSGCGKSTLGQNLARALRLPYLEGDALHPRSNVEKMAAGIPLTDEDRYPWLGQVAEALKTGVMPENRDGLEHCTYAGAVASCSALTQAYRGYLRSAVGSDLIFVFLYGDRAIVAERLSKRKAHYMPLSLLQSQFDTLEPPTAEANVICVDYALSPTQQVETALYLLNATQKLRSDAPLAFAPRADAG